MDIEDMFRDLERAEHIENLFPYQADILRDYCEKHVQTSDVGIELPTGSGKTLVGLLIGEWRRRTLNQRILYLCPNKLLAYQVAKHSEEYGIPTEVFVGPKTGYNPEKLSSYQAGDIIAISNYSGLFNVNPGINDPQIIILDDAHGAESYIGSMWSISINRRTHPDLYASIFQTFEKDLPSRFCDNINSGTRERITHRVEKVPYGAFFRSLDVIKNILDSVDGNIKINADIFFSWQAIGDSLQACQIYISFNSILIRSYIPPTLTHKPFEGSDQRIYMSATLGRGGELERITGVRQIQRILTPRRYKKRGIGRRLYLFPDYSLTPDDYREWLVQRIDNSERTLIMCPSWNRLSKFEELIKGCSSNPLQLKAQNIEETMDPFTDAAHSVLLLANRYDGIDLPNGVCTQVIIDGLPTGTNLQEAFLEERLDLDVLLRERIKTRIQQASGRCTRADKDRVAIIMTDKKLMNFCQKSENQRIMHPEIRAEIRFGLRQKGQTNNFNVLLKAFEDNDENWKQAEENIVKLRDSYDPMDTTITDILEKSVKHEVDYSYAMWRGEYERAVEQAILVSDNLSHRSLNPYRALWNYYVAAATLTVPDSVARYNSIRKDYSKRALAAGRLISWFPNAVRSLESEASIPEDSLINQALAVEGILGFLIDIGSVGPKFSNKIEEIEALLNETDADKFDRGLVALGGLLGFSSLRPAGDGCPDAYWQLENRLCFVLEGKSYEHPDSGISIQNCRQTAGHRSWARSKKYLKNVVDLQVCLISPRSTIDPAAIPYGEGVYYLHIEEIRNLFQKTKHMLLESRPYLDSEDNDTIKEKILENILRLDLTPAHLKNLITSTTVTSLPHSE